jgi:16S rRNA (guanine966-N2)-methyltransferase
MKILSGSLKNRVIHISKKQIFRPTKSIVRKSLFDSLGLIEKRSFLDLFSGSGINSFEAISRGSKNVSLVEIDRTAIKNIKKNIFHLELENIIVYQRDVFRFLNQCDNYDIIFADPPYGLYDLEKLIALSLKKLNPEGVFILECSENESLEGYYKIAKFGGSKLLYWNK